MSQMIRHAREEDCPFLYDLLLEIFQDMELPVLGMIHADDLKKLFIASMEEPHSRYSYKNCLVYEHEQKIIGCCFSYKGELEQQLNESIQEKLIAYGFDSSFQFYPDKETAVGEWYLDAIVTKDGYRGKGIARKLIQALPKVATQQNETLIGLLCDQNNNRARALYQKLGFKKVSERFVSGHRYDHMQKAVG